MVTATSKSTDQADLVTILRTYNEVAERLKRSHEALAAEVRRLREELNEKNRELQRRERLAALGEMAAGVAHEIRNPLGGIGLYASLLERDLADRPNQQEIARRISAGVQNAETIVRDILAFAGGAKLKIGRVLLENVVEAVLAQTAPQAKAHDITVEVDPRLAKLELFGDSGQIERALLNLIYNAIDAAGEGGHVWVRAGGHAKSEGSTGERSGEESAGGAGRVPIIVEDDGPGIDPELRQRVFDPFFTTKDTGTGLGLAIVHGIAEAHGGSVTAGCRRGGGASLTLSLPGGVVGSGRLSSGRRAVALK